MMRHISLLAALVVCTTAIAITPTDLPLIGPVTHGGGDADFLAMLPTLEASFSNVSPSSSPGPDFIEYQGWTTEFFNTMRVYMISKDSGYPNAIGITTTVGDISTGTMLWDSSDGLSAGDYVQITGAHTGSFFAMTAENSTGGNLWWDNHNLNADQLSHIQGDLVSASPDGLWYSFALDDQFGGGDRDWNDVRLAVRFLNVTAPEPAVWTLLAGFAAIGVWLWRRRSALA